MSTSQWDCASMKGSETRLFSADSPSVFTDIPSVMAPGQNPPCFCWSHWNDLDSDNGLQSHLSLLLPGYFHQGTDFFSLECAKLDATEWNFVFYPSSLFVGAKDHFSRPTEECGTLPENWSKYSNSDATHAFSLALSLSHTHKLSIFLKNLI